LLVERQLFEWLVRYGPPLLFVAQVFGIFGLPIPDELLLTLAGVLIRRGQLAAGPTILSAIAGCIVGITFSYVLGRTIGLATIRHVFRVHERPLARAQRWFQRFGCWLLAFGYYIPGVRHVTAIAAGSAPLQYSTFGLYAYPGAVLWCATFIGVGYFAGNRWQELLEDVRRHTALVAVGATVALMVYGAFARSRRRRSHSSL
jgi:membrane protein DedA with SNARE-associated domain